MALSLTDWTVGDCGDCSCTLVRIEWWKGNRPTVTREQFTTVRIVALEPVAA